MIKIDEGELLNVIPSNMKTPEIIAISHALKKGFHKAQELANRTRTYSIVQNLPDDILDVLAVELRTMYYSEDLPLNKKRDIIQNTLLWHHKAGTPYAVEELVKTLFGEGKVIEWFDFKEGPGQPGTFDIETEAISNPDIIDEFVQIIKKVKNTRSHLRKIKTLRLIEGNYFSACRVSCNSRIVIR